MSHALDIRAPSGTRVTDTSLSFTRPDMTEEDWERLLAALVRVRARSPWWIGDAIAFGESRWGRTYEPAAKVTGLSPRTLRNYAWVARRVSPEVRDPRLPYRAHQLVAKLRPGEQRAWLGRARKWRWTSGQLEAEMRAAERAARDGGNSLQKPSLQTEHRCPACGYEW